MKMHPIATFSPGRKRQMVLVPEINPRSFLFFFEKGAAGFSYCLRDYSIRNHVTERRARDLGWTADEVRRKATHILDAPYMDVNLLGEWHSYTTALNKSQGICPAESAILVPSIPGIQGGNRAALPTTFPLLDPDALAALPKWAKSGDIRRMLESPQSEDWVTWNLLNLVLRCRPDTWWTQLSARIREANPNLRVLSPTTVPKVRFWQPVASPKEYEALSRERMRRSSDPMIAARSRAPQPVEGNSEIDLIIESSSLLVYIEAKLDSDISMRTTYDPDRNQIIRNIDCLLDSARGRTPFFWMFVRDASSTRAYTQLMRQYQEGPQTLSRHLPHRDPALLQHVAQSLTILTWREIAQGLCAPCTADDEKLLSIKHELWRRIQ
jgi:hypothetical protein